MKAKDIEKEYSALWFKMKEQLQMDYNHVLDMACGYATCGHSNAIVPEETMDEYRKILGHYEFMKNYLEFCEGKYLPEEESK